jgi:3-oxoadipate enol-lactonase
MPFADLGGLSLFFERLGAGPPLLFVGGTGGDLRRPETRLFGPLPRHFEVLAFDQRGMGQSGKPDVPARMRDYADDAARLMDFAGWPAALVMGFSFGGMVAQELALRHPHKVRRLLLCSTSSGGKGGASFPFHTLPPMPAEARAALQVRIADIRHDDGWAAAHPADYQARLAMALRDPFAAEPGHAAGARRQLEARAGHDTWDRLPAVAVPTLVVGGCHDGIAPPDRQRALAARIPGAQFRLFEGGHFFMLDDKAAWPALTEFLGA